MRRSNIPVFIKIWFGFVALITIGMIAGLVYIGAQIIEAGPEGIGNEIGRAVKSYNDAVK